MHISLTLPHPLARLNRVLVALERARAGSPLETHDENGLLLGRDEPGAKTASEYSPDMEFLSLSRCEQTPARRSDDLDFLSLSRVDETAPDCRDILSDMSLERPFPPRPSP
jgi:hypothetical protein